MTLEVSGLTVTFPRRGAPTERVPVVSDVSFSLSPGRCLGLVGESGSGKSMTALSLLRLVPKPGRIESGRLELDGLDLRGLSVPEMRRVRGKRLAMIFQEPMSSLNPVERVGDQVAEAILLHENVSKRAARERVLELLREVGIPDEADRYNAYPHQLSGGLKQRIMIAMALSLRPEVLLADEPTTALDVTIQAQVLHLLRELCREKKTALLLITHDLGVVSEMADEVAVLYAGKMVERGLTSEVLRAPAHPYTKGLLEALPSRAAGRRLREIPGVVPPPHALPLGCRFQTRCPERAGICTEKSPELLPVLAPTGRLVSCHLRHPETEAR